jgi:hypothetical protein
MKLMPSQTLDDGVDLFIWGNAESCVTIIAACIPILRVFVREAHTSAKRYYVSTEEGAHTDFGSKTKRSKMQSHDSPTIVVSAKHSRSARYNGDDDFSDKSILDGFSSNGKHIVQTNEGAVEYEMGHVPPK